MNIETDFYVKPWYSQELLSPTLKKYVGTSTQPYEKALQHPKIVFSRLFQRQDHTEMAQDLWSKSVGS